MKFVRFGSLSLQKQTHYQEPKQGMWPCYPPCKKGFFAFPAGYSDIFYLPHSRPPEHPYSILQYLRDENGMKLFRGDLYSEYGFFEKILSERGIEILKKRKLKEKQIMWVKRPSYVMVRPDTEKSLTFFGLSTEQEDRSRLNQDLEYLLDPRGEKIDADDFFYYTFHNLFPQNYEGDYNPPKPGVHYNSKEKLYYPDGKTIAFSQWLEKKGIVPEQLCMWPFHKRMEAHYAAILKKYHVFDYDGCLWHHLGIFLKPGEILSRFSDTWVYTDMHAYKRALKKSNGTKYWQNMRYQRDMEHPGYYEAFTPNGMYDPPTMYEVFFDEKIS